MERNIKIANKEFEIVPSFKKSCKLTKYRNKMRYGNVEVTEETKPYFLEIEQLRQETKEGEEPDITKLSIGALKILQEMSDKSGNAFEYDEMLEMGKIIFEIEDAEELEELYEKEFEENGYEELTSKILYGLALVFMNAKDGFTRNREKTINQKKQGHQSSITINDIKTIEEEIDYYYTDLLPCALMCGMTTEEFWNGEPRVLQSYIKKHELELDEMNEQAWLSSFYVFKAINVALSNCLPNKNAIAETYFEKPLEEFNSSYYMKEKQEKIDDNNYRKNTNYWAQIGTKGVH